MRTGRLLTVLTVTAADDLHRRASDGRTGGDDDLGRALAERRRCVLIEPRALVPTADQRERQHRSVPHTASIPDAGKLAQRQ